ncbi:endonuclease/exonuclease/phosphatase family protein [Marmoricola sp. URHA0025 HA25]
MGGVALVWALTFVLMGSDVLPAVSHHDTPKAAATSKTATSKATASASASAPSATPSGTATPDTPALAAAAAEQLAQAKPLAGKVLVHRPNPRRSAPPVLTFRMATFNALGSSHTRGRNHRKQKASGPARTARAGGYVLDNDIDLVGFQELQADQRGAFMNATGGRFALYPGNELGNGDGENSIAYRLDTWELVKADSIAIPYFGGRPRNMPILLLKNKKTGITAYFMNFHNPADTAEFGKQGRWRAAATDREVALFNQLKDDGYPLFATGDMNDRGPWFCAVAPAGNLVAAAATVFGQNGCDVPGFRIDWIVGSQGVEFSGYHEDKSGLVSWMTDHPVVVTDVTVDSTVFPKSLTAPADTPPA